MEIVCCRRADSDRLMAKKPASASGKREMDRRIARKRRPILVVKNRPGFIDFGGNGPRSGPLNSSDLAGSVAEPFSQLGARANICEPAVEFQIGLLYAARPELFNKQARAILC